MNDSSHPQEGNVHNRFIEVSVEGHFLWKPPQTGLAEAIIVGFHGYAENAEIHLARMEKIPFADRYGLCSIQALHPFYLRKTGEVVASWMTRFHRDCAILENQRYVDKVLDQIAGEVRSEIPLVLFGFSQGAAMAYRAAASHRHPSTGIIVLGGDVPPDIASHPSIQLPPVLLGRGKDDLLYPSEQFLKDQSVLKGRGVENHGCVFEGAHEWAPEFADRVGEFLSNLIPN